MSRVRQRPEDEPPFAALWRAFGATYARDGGLIGPVAAAFLFLPGLAHAVLFGAAEGASRGVLPVLALGFVVFVGVVGQGVIVRIALDSGGREGRPLGTAIGEAQALSLRLLVLGLLAGAAVFAGLLALILPGIYILARLAPAVPVLFAEKLAPFAALGRAWELTRPHAGAAFAFIGVVLIFAAVALFTTVLVGQALTSIGAGLGHEPLGRLVTQALLQAVSAAISVAVTLAEVAIYRFARGPAR